MIICIYHSLHGRAKNNMYMTDENYLFYSYDLKRVVMHSVLYRVNDTSFNEVNAQY